MSEITTVVLDAMGGDNAPAAMIDGAIDAISKEKNVKVILVGIEDVIRKGLEGKTYNPEQIEIVNATEVIETAEPPVHAIRRKKDSSIVVGMKLVKEGKADAFVSAGSSGAVLVGGQVIVGRIKGIQRPPLAPLIPTEKGISLLIDCGANVDARAEHLVQFAKMGSIYMKNIEGIENPRVGIINIGAEDEKGNELVKSTIPLLRECKDINFIGSVESRDIPNGPADVLVCEAFVGNVLLKFFEGLGKMFMAEIKDTLKSSVKTKIGGALIYKPIKKTFKRYMADDKGGAPLLGLKGLVVKIHGNSKDTEVRSAIEQCRNFVKKDVTNQIIRTFVEEENKGEN